MPAFADDLLSAAARCSAPNVVANIAHILDSAVPAPIDSLFDSESLDDLLSRDGERSVVLDLSPWAWVPTFRRNDTVVRPAAHICALRKAVERLQSPTRRHHAYIRHQPLDTLPVFEAALNASRLHALVGGSRVMRANLWLGDGGLASALHYDSFDNLLVQLRGEKSVLLLPPRAGSALHYAPLEEHRYVWDGTRFTGTEPTGNARVDNISPVRVGAIKLQPVHSDLLSTALLEAEERLGAASPAATGMEAWSGDGAILCRLVPGRTLFIPALWSHAVISSTAAAAMEEESCSSSSSSSSPSPPPPPPSRELNAAINVWYVRGSESVDTALSSGAGEWPAARAALGIVLPRIGRLAALEGRYEEAVKAFGRLTKLDPSNAEARQSYQLALQDAERSRLERAISSNRGWDRELEKRLRHGEGSAPAPAAAAASAAAAAEPAAAAREGSTDLGRHWDAHRCRTDRTEGVAEACAFSSKAWGVGNARRGSWDADLEKAAVLTSDDPVATAQVINDARELRFVRFDNTLVARGLPTVEHTPGMSNTPWHVYARQQGLASAIEYLGLPMMKMSWDLSIYSMALDELQPKTIIELGTGSGATAMWLADEGRKRRMELEVHTFDIKTSDEIAVAHGLDATMWQQLLRQRRVTHHGLSDLTNVKHALPQSLLRSLPHPWLVIEDAHANTLEVVKRLFKHMEAGDYLVCEDIRFGEAKRRAWFAFLKECGERCALDLKYLDFFGVNQCCAPDGWVKKVV